MFDLKVINSVLNELENERGIPREKIIEAIGSALATAYRKEHGKKGQKVRANFDLASGLTTFEQVKTVVDETRVKMPEETEAESLGEKEIDPEDFRPRFNEEHHILIADAKRIKRDAELDEEIIFPLETKGDFGRIAAQTAKQVIIQKIREAEKVSVVAEFGKRQGEIVVGTVERLERGTIYVNLGRTFGLLSYEEQIPGERYKQGERVRAYLFSVDDSTRGVFLKLSRSHPKFLAKLFEQETPEISNGVVEIKSIAREAGSRSKVAVASNDQHIDPVGSLVGQRGVRVSTVMSELGGEKIDVIEWSEDPKKFIEDSLSPAKVISVALDVENRQATVTVTEDQQSLAIGKGGQNVRLAAKLTGWRIDITSLGGENVASSEEEGANK
ncbi:MAG: transcription termination factor NusA [bacterium]|nr:transcription termination factor NusA [bacterium]